MTAFFFIRFLVPGEAPRGSQTFRLRDAATRYARRARLERPTWGYQIIRHAADGQTVVEETDE